MSTLPQIPTDRAEIVEWVIGHLGHLSRDEVRASPIVGGQAAADTALATLDLTNYASRRSEVLPVNRRGASQLSPYIRHGLLTLPEVWAAAADAPPRDKGKFRDELLWQEYARHVYARIGRALGEPLRFGAPSAGGSWLGQPWPDEMACMAMTNNGLHDDGWLVNQTRMWVASQWAARAGADWRVGERAMFAELLDGSYANRLGWQWTIGTGTGKVYGFSRWQVEKRAPGLCFTCSLKKKCPIEGWPEATPGPRLDPDLGGTTDPGPAAPDVSGEPEVVWLTAESLGSTDPALLAHPDLPRVFVFDEPLLASLRLSGKRLVFLAEALASHDRLEVLLGDPVEELAGRQLATTWNFTPGFARRRAALDVTALHPWPWLRRPGSEKIQSFSAWAR